MNGQTRKQHHAFAHEILLNDAHRFPVETWDALASRDAASLAMQWEMAQSDDVALPSTGLGVEGIVPRVEWESLVVRMPPPIGPSEAFYIALPRRPASPKDLGYFVMEKGVSDQAHATEWREGGVRNPLGALPAPTLD